MRKLLFTLTAISGMTLISCREEGASGNKGDMPVNNTWKNDDPTNGGTTGYINPKTDSTRDNQRFHDYK
ncbi:MAG: hypothetical protein ACJ77K_07660 [Bacteroidia bacterium]